MFIYSAIFYWNVLPNAYRDIPMLWFGACDPADLISRHMVWLSSRPVKFFWSNDNRTRISFHATITIQQTASPEYLLWNCLFPFSYHSWNLTNLLPPGASWEVENTGCYFPVPCILHSNQAWKNNRPSLIRYQVNVRNSCDIPFEPGTLESVTS